MSLDVLENLDVIQTAGEMKDPPFKNSVLSNYSWLFHSTITLGLLASGLYI